MQSIIEIEKLIQKNRNDPDAIANIFYFFMFEGHQQYSEIRKIPISLAFKLMKLYDKKQKEMERQMKKRRRK